jgi:hypothetical protein
MSIGIKLNGKGKDFVPVGKCGEPLEVFEGVAVAVVELGEPVEVVKVDGAAVDEAD